MKSKSIYEVGSDGTERWWLCTDDCLTYKLHREEDLPAVVFTDGRKTWYVNGIRHRTTGPAIVRADGTKEWYLNGEQIDCHSQEEFEKIVKLLIFF